MTNFEIDNAYMGTSQVSALYLGEDKIYPTTQPEPENTAYIMVDGSQRIDLTAFDTDIWEDDFSGQDIYGTGFTLYHNGEVVAANTLNYLILDTNYQTLEQFEDYDIAVQDYNPWGTELVLLGIQYDAGDESVQILFMDPNQ